MKVVIYGMGNIFNLHKESIQWNDVIAIVDKNPKVFDDLNVNIPIFLAEDIPKLQFDFVVVFSDALYGAICNELNGKYCVPLDRILSWRVYISEKPQVFSNNLKKFYLMQIDNKKIKKVLDVGMKNLPRFFVSKCGLENVQIHGVGDAFYPFYDVR